MTPRPLLPPRLLPILYFAFAHISVTLAFGAVAMDPRGVAGFYYHSRMLAIVHLVTLGWLTSSILGSLYLLGPIALRTRFQAAWLDYAAALCVGTGIAGMASHFWIQEYRGMAWSGAAAGCGILLVGIRIYRPLRRAPIHPAIRTHILLAFVNASGAALMGVLLGINKVHPFLPGFVLTNVFAHAHLAAIGWVSMMIVGVSYRLLPMVLPAQMPDGPRLWSTAALLEIGAAGVFAALLTRSRFTWVCAVVIAAGFAVFLSQVWWMVRYRRPRPPAFPSLDPAVVHAGAALAYLAVACGLGLWLTLAPTSEATLRIATGYGVLGLVGFLAQMVVAMEGRILPLFAWYWASANAGPGGSVPPPHAMAWRTGRALTLGLWLAGVPSLAAGLAFVAIPFVRAGACLLLAATLLDSVQAVVVLRYAYSSGRLRCD